MIILTDEYLQVMDIKQSSLEEGSFTFQTAYSNESAGYDLHSMKDLILNPMVKTLIPTGIKINLPNKTLVALIQERGSIIKTPLIKSAGVVDYGYTGEIFVACTNVSERPYEIKKGTKLPFQLIITQVFHLPWQTESQIDSSFSNQTTLRKDSCLGSSDVKE